MKQKGFTLLELLVVVAIIGILAAIGVVSFGGFQRAAKVNATKTNFKTVVDFIRLNVQRCEIGESVYYDINKKLGTKTGDKCADIKNGKADEVVASVLGHYNANKWCNPYGMLHNSGTCQEGVAGAGKSSCHIGEVCINHDCQQTGVSGGIAQFSCKPAIYIYSNPGENEDKQSAVIALE